MERDLGMRIDEANVLVTGGVGFVGSHLVGRLVSLANETVVFDNLSSGNLDNLKDAV